MAEKFQGQLQIEVFTPGVSKLERWLQRLEGTFQILDVKGEARAPYLLHYIGPTAFDTLCDHLNSIEPATQSYDTLLSKLKELYAPATLEIAKNYKFTLRKQQAGEDVQSFATALNKLSQTCNFGTYHKTALRNQFVFGLLNKRTQARLLETKDLTYDKALQTAVAIELSEKSTQTLHNQQSTTIDYIQASKKPARKGTTQKSGREGYNKNTSKKNDGQKSSCKKNNAACYGCGGEHFATKCQYAAKIK